MSQNQDFDPALHDPKREDTNTSKPAGRTDTSKPAGRTDTSKPGARHDGAGGESETDGSPADERPVA